MRFMQSLIESNKFKLSILLLLLILFGKILSFYIDENSVPMAGEIHYSTSYSTYTQWLLTDILENPKLLMQIDSCPDCPSFGMRSRWISIPFFILMTPADYLGIHPLIWIQIINLLLSFIGIHFLLKSIYYDFLLPISFLLSVFFVSIPYQMMYYVTTYEYVFLYFFLFISVGAAIRLIKRGVLSRNEFIITSSSLLLIFNLALIILPMSIWFWIVVFTITLVKFKHNWNRILGLYFKLFLPTTILNSPMIFSLLKSKSLPYFENFIGLKWIEVITWGYYSTQLPTYNNITLALVFWGLIITSLLLFGKKNIIKITTVTITLSVFFGLMAQGLLYGPIFKYLPLFTTFRSSYRFSLFQQISLVVMIAIIYKSTCVSNTKKKLFLIIFSSMLLINAVYTYNNISIFNLTKIPKEYQTARISMSKENRYLYLPTKLNTSHQISTDFKFGKNSTIYYWYQNPMELWYPARNLHHPTKNMTAASLNEQVFKLYQENSQAELVALLKYTGVDAIIFDGYYNWEREAPLFNVSQFISRQEVRLVGKFDKIKILYIK